MLQSLEKKTYYTIRAYYTGGSWFREGGISVLTLFHFSSIEPKSLTIDLIQVDLNQAGAWLTQHLGRARLKSLP